MKINRLISSPYLDEKEFFDLIEMVNEGEEIMYIQEDPGTTRGYQDPAYLAAFLKTLLKGSTGVIAYYSKQYMLDEINKKSEEIENWILTRLCRHAGYKDYENLSCSKKISLLMDQEDLAPKLHKYTKDRNLLKLMETLNDK